MFDDTNQLSKGSMCYSFKSVNVGKTENDIGRERRERTSLSFFSPSLSLVLSFGLLYQHCIDIVVDVSIVVEVELR